jgi:hypothetical protein
VLNVLERLPAQDKVESKIGVTLRIQIFHDADTVVPRGCVGRGNVAWIKPDALVVASLAKHAKELSITTTYFQDGFARETEIPDHTVCLGFRVSLKHGRVMQRILVSLPVLEALRIEGAVADKTTAPAIDQSDIPPRAPERRLSRVAQKIYVGWQVGKLEESPQLSRAARRAPGGALIPRFRHHRS